MRPGARRRIAHAMLLRQRQGNAALLQVGCATATGQGGLEGGELLCELWARWGGLTRRHWARRWRPGEWGRCLALAWCPLQAGRRPLKDRLALPLVLPALAGYLAEAPGAAGKAHEAVAAALAIRAMEGAQRPQCMA